MHLRPFFALLLLCATLCAGAELNTIVVFGDSTVDFSGRLYEASLATGFEFPPSWMYPYHTEGDDDFRMSNAAMYPEIMTAILESVHRGTQYRLRNFAVGGSTQDSDAGVSYVSTALFDQYTRVKEDCSPAPAFAVTTGVKQQIEEWRASDIFKRRGHTIALMGTGVGNDIIGAGISLPDFLDLYFQNVITLVKSGVPLLLLHDFPSTYPLPVQPYPEDQFNVIKAAYNDAFYNNVAVLEEAYPNVTFVVANMTYWRAKAETPASEFGISTLQYTSIPCLQACTPKATALESGTTCTHPENFLFFDLIHMTGVGEESLGKYFASLVMYTAASPASVLSFSVVLALCGLIAALP